MATDEKKAQERKKRAKNGERTQKMVAFRLDGDLAEWLQGVANKGRLINNLLREHQRKFPRFGQKGWQDPDEQPDARHDYQP